MANLLEMAAEIVASHASTTPMTQEELIAELNDLHQAVVKAGQWLKRFLKKKKHLKSPLFPAKRRSVKIKLSA